jgi:hypothetical protein
MADNAIALGIKVPDAMQSLGAVLGNANAAQQYKAGNLELQRKQALLPTDIERAQAESSSAVTAADLARQTLGANVTKANEGAKQSQIQTQQNQWVLNKEQSIIGHQQIGGLLTDPAIIAAAKAKTPEEQAAASPAAVDAVMAAQQRMVDLGIDPKRAAIIASPFLTDAAHAPHKLYDKRDSKVLPWLLRLRWWVMGSRP